MTDIAQQIVEQLDKDPPDNTDPHPKLFSDLDDERVEDRLFRLWRKGIVDADYDEDEQATVWRLSEFGVELIEAGLDRAYIAALENEAEIDATPTSLVDPSEFA